jgi:hypothetical protein
VLFCGLSACRLTDDVGLTWLHKDFSDNKARYIN